MKKFYQYRFIPLLVSVIFVAFCFGNYASVSMPYQEPTQEMLEKQLADIHLWERLTVIGSCVAILSAVLLLYFRRYKKHLRR
jgi:intracellular septation protein A